MEAYHYFEARPALRNINRWGMEFTMKDQSIPDHSYHVVTMFMLICKELELEPTANDLFLVLNHDFIESKTGDLNDRIKRISSFTKDAWDTIEGEAAGSELYTEYSDDAIMRALGPEMGLVFMLCDSLEALLYAHEEVSMGNTYLQKAKNHYFSKVMRFLSHKMFTEFTQCKYGFYHNLRQTLGEDV